MNIISQSTRQSALKTAFWGGIATLTMAGINSGNIAHAKILLNYDDLSSLEEPLAFGVGDLTIRLTGLVDAPVSVNIDKAVFDGDYDVSIRGNFEVNGEIQLGNRWDIGASYFGEYDEFTDDYDDNIAGYIRTSWGTLIGGNVNGLVRENTRRQRGIGNAALAFDDFYGQLARWGGGYSGRFGPTIITGVVDENGDFQMGIEYQRPLGKNDIRLASRIGQSGFDSADGTRRFRSRGGIATAEIVYGSSLFDISGGYENIQSQLIDLDRWFVSGGMQTKMGTLSLSAEGHYGQIGGSEEKSASLGIAYDLARGLSTNIGVNYRDAQVERDGVNIIDEDETTATASIRYSF